ncbi:uncharacterized protein LOC134812149 [Bolinopsis microptera]|uniref:uncharacterized protein LOC134812149 n=1 Tax=Bolinopsis microptera TaxID=2820187 RepID=UPI00307AFA45
MIKEAVLELKELQLQQRDQFTDSSTNKRYRGNTAQSVIKFIIQHNDFPKSNINEDRVKQDMKREIKKMINEGELIKLSGTATGLIGRFKLNEPRIKKTAPKKSTKKKSTDKKPVPKKKSAILDNAGSVKEASAKMNRKINCD